MSGPRVLAVRLDSDGDVLLTGPAIRALAGPGRTAQVDLLVSPAGRQAGELLPGVAGILEFAAPWTGYRAPPVDRVAVTELLGRIDRGRYDLAVVFTSFHQSPLPMALLSRLAGVPRVAATSVDYPGSLLDVRHTRPPGHEVTAMLGLAVAAGGQLPPDDDGRLAVRRPLPAVDHLVPNRPYVVLHPAASVPARGLQPEHAGTILRTLIEAGHAVVVTGGPDDGPITARVLTAARTVENTDDVTDLTGRTTLAELAGVLAGADCVVVGNTGPAHLAAAVGTPVVSLFAPVVPVERWAPYGVPSVLLGDQQAACRGTRARECPVPGHPCLTSVRPLEVLHAIAALTDGAHRVVENPDAVGADR